MSKKKAKKEKQLDPAIWDVFHWDYFRWDVVDVEKPVKKEKTK